MLLQIEQDYWSILQKTLVQVRSPEALPNPMYIHPHKYIPKNCDQELVIENIQNFTEEVQQHHLLQLLETSEKR